MYDGKLTCIMSKLRNMTLYRILNLNYESCYPYTASDNSCSNACSDWQYNTYKISDWYRVNPVVDEIKYAIYNYGPLVATMAVYTDFLYYGSGIYTKSWGNFEGYHTAMVVGYDDTEQYFIVKNSWGTDWGESGFFRIAYSEVNSDVLFGYWTIVYENQIPDDFPEIEDIPRARLSEQIAEDKNEGKHESLDVSCFPSFLSSAICSLSLARGISSISGKSSGI